ncbi:MAG TPA: hypothetical protein ENH00_12485 [Actinobacteria bacterium]|nr:doubled CXXCH motif [bacterium BMS3Bbin01]HDH26990.1 hypothetical protein [Actinomycetota bacterium]
MRGKWRIWLPVCLGAVFILALGSIASAQPKEADPSGADQIAPHGGYSSSTNMCLQCHDVHDAAGTYALMATASVDAVCSTCHASGIGATQPENPPGGGPGPISNATGTVSTRAVYTETSGSEHPLGNNKVDDNWLTQSDWSYPGPPTDNATTHADIGTTSDTDGGLYCASCHTPHGSFGQVVNNWTKPTAANPSVFNYEGTSIEVDNGAVPLVWTTVWLDYDETEDAWAFCDTLGHVVTATDTGFDSCETTQATASVSSWATVKNAANQDSYLFAYNLLSAGPNHQYGAGHSTFRTVDKGTDVYDWCATCHTSKSSTMHNHYTTCYACHGNPSADTNSKDFPHSSTADTLLKAYPDGMCVNCHTSGSLP